MHPIARLAGCLALVAVPTACRAVPGGAYASLEARSSAPVVYAAELKAGAVRVDDLASAWEPAEDAARSEVVLDVRARLFALRAEDAADAFGCPEHAQQALLVDRAAAERLLDRMIADGRASEAGAPRLTARAGEGATLSVVNRVAYLESYSVRGEGDVLVADPNVGVAEQGFVLGVEPAPPAADGTIELSLELASAALARPLDALETHLPGATAAVTIQAPVTLIQKLATVVRLGADEALVLGGLASEEAGLLLFVMVTVRELAQ